MPGITLDQLEANYFNFDGRLSRRRYQKLFFVLFVVYFCFYVALIMSGSMILSLLMYPIGIALMIGNYSTAIRRFHDLDQTGWFSILLIIPGINLLVLIYLLFAPGSIVPNKYDVI